MRRLPVVDAALLGLLLPLWLVSSALYLKQVRSGRLAWVGVCVSAPRTASDYPIVSDVWPGTDVEAAGLAIGDRLLRVDRIDLRGVGPFGFVARVHEVATPDFRVPVVYQRADGTIGEGSFHLSPIVFPWRILPLTVTLVATACLVLVRRPGTPIARAFFLMAIAYSLHWTFFFGGPRLQTYTWTVVFSIASLVMLPLILRAILLFPEEVAPPKGRLPWWPWIFAIFGPISLSWTYGVPFSPTVGFRAVFVVNVAFIITLLAVITAHYRRAGPIGRRQLKWVVYGIYVGTVPVLLADVVTLFEPSLWWLHEIAVITEAVIPICILIAIVRSNYFDIDYLITGTAAYSCLSVLLMVALLTIVPLLARLASAATDVDPRTGQLLLSVVVAIGIVPSQRYLRPQVERVLFRERHDLKRGVELLLGELSAANDPEALLTVVGERLSELLRPEACCIYAPAGEGYAPVFLRGNVDDPPVFSAESRMIETLRSRAAPLDVDQIHKRPQTAFGAAERDGLGRLRAMLLLPLRRGDTLAGFVSLGQKRSRDVYTSTDLALLTAVSDKVSGELLRFGMEDILRQERAMGEALRRYVPESVAARITSGRDVGGGEQDISVLFVDIRGSTAYAEAQSADTVFSLVDRYTEAVSTVIRGRGGTVVEFLGDGVMAVFGAPEPLASHQRAAVEAARQIVARVNDLDFADEHPDFRIAVGVGVASGRAFVGNVRTGDRLVYTAIGDTVNLASRVQSLTRELGASIAIDAATFDAARERAGDFIRHERVPIRGRREPVDVYTLAR